MRAVLLLWMVFSSMAFSDIKVMISNEDRLISVSQKKLADLYLGKTDNIDGIKVIPIDNKDGYREFYQKIIKKSPKQLKEYWMREIYKGNRTPPKKMTSREIKKIMKHKKVIAYGRSKIDGAIVMNIN